MVSRIVASETKESFRLIAMGLTPAAALTTFGRIKTSFRLLGRSPFRGRARDAALRPGLRGLPSGRYLIVYRATPSVVTILRVIDARRDDQALFQL